MNQFRQMKQSEAVRKLLVTDNDVMAEAELIAARTLADVNNVTDDCQTTTEVARALGIECEYLNSYLKDIEVLVRRGSGFRLAPNYEGRGLEKYRLFIYYSKDGKQKRRRYLVWTQKGVDFILKLINH